MSKQTAVEWLVEEINKNGEEIHKNGNWIPTHMIEQAKQMYSKEELADLIDATFQGRQDVADLFSELLKNLKTK